MPGAYSRFSIPQFHAKSMPGSVVINSTPRKKNNSTFCIHRFRSRLWKRRFQVLFRTPVKGNFYRCHYCLSNSSPRVRIQFVNSTILWCNFRIRLIPCLAYISRFYNHQSHSKKTFRAGVFVNSSPVERGDSRFHTLWRVILQVPYSL